MEERRQQAKSWAIYGHGSAGRTYSEMQQLWAPRSRQLGLPWNCKFRRCSWKGGG